jgi:signal transduction histidine kinase
VAESRARALDRHERQRRILRVLLVVVAAATVGSTLSSLPSHDRGRLLAVLAALALYVAAVAWTAMVGWRSRDEAIVVLLVLSAAGLTLDGVASGAASALPASAAVLLALLRTPTRTALAIAVPVTAGIAVEAALLSSNPGASAAGDVLLCLTLGVVGLQLRQSRESEDRTEALLAELQDAHDALEAAAAGAERARIARELHDVLAHSLAGLTVQLEAALGLAGRDGASPDLLSVLGRSRTRG